jgi:hypothetical protein
MAFRVDNSKASGSKPTRGAVGPVPDGFFNIVGGVGTTLDPDWCNMVQDEIIKPVTEAGLTPDKTDDTQLYQAIIALIKKSTNPSLFQYQEVSGTAGAALTNSTWTKVPLATTVVNNITGVSIASSVISVPAGTYSCSFFAGALSPSSPHPVYVKTRIRDTTTPATLCVGASSISSDSADNQVVSTSSSGDSIFTITSTTSIELQVYASIAAGSLIMGAATTSGEAELYGWVKLNEI